MTRNSAVREEERKNGGRGERRRNGKKCLAGDKFLLGSRKRALSRLIYQRNRASAEERFMGYEIIKKSFFQNGVICTRNFPNRECSLGFSLEEQREGIFRIFKLSFSNGTRCTISLDRNNR